jgi:hypothetical protein
LAACTSTVKGPDETSLTLARPADQSMRQGETNQVSIMIQRQNFSKAVPVDFSGLPSGVKIIEKDLEIPSGDATRTFTLYADNDAELVSNHKVLVTVEGPGGTKVTEIFRLSVKAKP